jgi:dihydrofolate reductase
VRKVIANEWMTLDGVVQAPSYADEDTTGGFEHGGWHTRYFDDLSMGWVIENVTGAGGFLLGRGTYEIFAAHWPNAPEEQQVLAEPLNTLPKYVASTTLNEPLAWQNAKLLRGDLREAVSALKSEEGSDLHVIGSPGLVHSLMEHLIFNEGYLTSGGPELARSELSGEAIRLARIVRRALPDDPEVAGLLALMLLTEARRVARTGANGELIPLAEQDRSLWDRDLIAEGLGLLATASSKRAAGECLVQAQIAALHDQATLYEDTDWREIAALYGLLERMTGNPMVSLNRAIAVAMVEGPRAGLVLLEPLEQPLGGHHRLHAIRAHLLEMAGDVDAAMGEYETAARRTTSIAEQDYLTMRAARLNEGRRIPSQRRRHEEL